MQQRYQCQISIVQLYLGVLGCVTIFLSKLGNVAQTAKLVETEQREQEG